MDAKLIKQYGDELYHAMQSKQAVAPLTARESDISIEDAYHISLQMLNRRVDAGAKVIGKKIGVTSKAVQSMLNVHQPDFGYLTDDMVFNQGEVMPISERLIAPKAEGWRNCAMKRVSSPAFRRPLPPCFQPRGSAG